MAILLPTATFLFYFQRLRLQGYSTCNCYFLFIFQRLRSRVDRLEIQFFMAILLPTATCLFYFQRLHLRHIKTVRRATSGMSAPRMKRSHPPRRQPFRNDKKSAREKRHKGNTRQATTAHQHKGSTRGQHKAGNNNKQAQGEHKTDTRRAWLSSFSGGRRRSSVAEGNGGTVCIAQSVGHILSSPGGAGYFKLDIIYIKSASSPASAPATPAAAGHPP